MSRAGTELPVQGHARVGPTANHRHVGLHAADLQRRVSCAESVLRVAGARANLSSRSPSCLIQTRRAGLSPRIRDSVRRGSGGLFFTRAAARLLRPPVPRRQDLADGGQRLLARRQPARRTEPGRRHPARPAHRRQVRLRRTAAPHRCAAATSAASPTCARSLPPTSHFGPRQGLPVFFVAVTKVWQNAYNEWAYCRWRTP
jgi:hypothetical protein